MHKFLIILLFGIGTIACNSTNNEVSSSGGQGQVPVVNTSTNANIAENKPVENKPPINVNKQSDEMPKFKEGEDYKSVRGKLIKAGWVPFKSKDAQKCDGEDDRCKDFPEMEACAGTGLGNCSYLWKKGNKTLAIYTIGDFPNYNGQEFIKTAKQNEADKNDPSWRGGALVNAPPSNVRESPAGKVICVIREKKTIMLQGSTNITDDDGEWIRTDACGKSGVIHSTQINMIN